MSNLSAGQLTPVTPTRLCRCLFLLVLPLLVGGCGSILSGAGPSIAAINEAKDQDYTVVDLSAGTIGPYMRPKEAEMEAGVSKTAIPVVRLVPGDSIKITISDSSQEGAIFAPLATGGTVFSEIRVDADGTISLPYVGRPKVAGLTPHQVEALILRRVRNVATDPQVQVALTGDLSGSVLVAGAVKSPGRFSALQGPLTLLDAINQAGGPTMEPHLIRVTVRDGKTVQSFGYDEILAGRNQMVAPHSEIIVERARKRYVAMGSVTMPGLHDLPSNNPSLLEVLGNVGGLDERAADPSGVFVFRLSEEEGTGIPKAQVFRLNMKDPAAIFLARQFLVQPEDAIYVTNAAVYEWQKIISPIVQVLVLGRTIRTGY